MKPISPPTSAPAIASDMRLIASNYKSDGICNLNAVQDASMTFAPCRTRSAINSHSGAILITGRTLRHWFPYDSWNVRLWLVVCHVKDHVPKFAFVHEVTAFWTLKEVFFFFVA